MKNSRADKKAAGRIKKKNPYPDNKAAFLFLLPCMAGFVIFVAVPVLASLGLSFTEWNFLGGLKNIKFVGLENFKYFFSGKDAWFSTSFWNTLLFAAVTVPVGLALGLMLASVINRNVYGSAVFRFVVFIPYISSIVASVVVWNEIERLIAGETIRRWFAWS